MMLGARTAVWSSKPLPYLRRVAYLESHGAEYIDTELIPLIGDSFKIDFSYMKSTFNSSWQQLISAGSGTYQIAFPFGKDYVINGNGLYARIFGGGSGYASQAINVPELKRDSKITLNVESQGNGVYNISIGSAFVTNNAIRELDGDHRSLLIFSRYGVGNGLFKVFGFEVYRGNSVLMKSSPVLDLSGRPAMYDEVSGNLFYNQGTGEFTWGELET